MSDGSDSFDAFLARVESLATLNERVAKEAEKPVADAVRKTAAAGTSPTGEAWPAKKDGGQALSSAAAAIESSAKGKTIELKIGPPFVFHNFGAGGSSTTKEAERHRERTQTRQAKTGTSSKFHAPKRQILPTPGDELPKPIADAIATAAARVLGKTVGG